MIVVATDCLMKVLQPTTSVNLPICADGLLGADARGSFG